MSFHSISKPTLWIYPCLANDILDLLCGVWLVTGDKVALHTLVIHTQVRHQNPVQLLFHKAFRAEYDYHVPLDILVLVFVHSY